MVVKSKDNFGDRMKEYERQETSRRFDPTLPIYVRIDGRGFSKFTKGMSRPYDLEMSTAMIETTKHLVEKTHADLGYTQSDEISLVFGPKEGKEFFFGGKIQKFVSVLAGMTTAKFMSVCPKGYEDRLPHFDCRAFQLPSLEEAANAVLWREMDAQKNSISMLGRHYFSAKQMHLKSGKEIIEMLKSKGISYETYPPFFKRGTFLRRETVLRNMTSEELSFIPVDHWPTGPVERSSIKTLNIPRFVRVANRVDVIFNNATPEIIT